MFPFCYLLSATETQQVLFSDLSHSQGRFSQISPGRRKKEEGRDAAAHQELSLHRAGHQIWVSARVCLKTRTGLSLHHRTSQLPCVRCCTPAAPHPNKPPGRAALCCSHCEWEFIVLLRCWTMKRAFKKQQMSGCQPKGPVLEAFRDSLVPWSASSQ